MPSRRARTAEEFARELAADAAYQTRMAEQDAATRALASACAADEAALLTELRNAGQAVASVYDFLLIGGAPEAAVPILGAHLAQPHHPRIWEGIVRALSTPAARAVALEPLSAAFVAEADPSRRWVLANALGSMAQYTELAHLPAIAEYREVFRQSRKPAHIPPAS